MNDKDAMNEPDVLEDDPPVLSVSDGEQEATQAAEPDQAIEGDPAVEAEFQRFVEQEAVRDYSRALSSNVGGKGASESANQPQRPRHKKKKPRAGAGKRIKSPQDKQTKAQQRQEADNQLVRGVLLHSLTAAGLMLLEEGRELAAVNEFQRNMRLRIDQLARDTLINQRAAVKTNQALKAKRAAAASGDSGEAVVGVVGESGQDPAEHPPWGQARGRIKGED